MQAVLHLPFLTGWVPVLCGDLMASAVDVGLQCRPAGVGAAARALEGLAAVLCVPLQVPLRAVRVAALTAFVLLFRMHFHKVLFDERKLRKWSVRASRASFNWTTVELR